MWYVQKNISKLRNWTEFAEFFLFILVTVLLCSASSFIYTLIPLHNLILYPSYWYETLFISTYWSMWTGLCITYYCVWILKLRHTGGVRHCLVIFLSMSVIAIMSRIAMYMIWAYALHFRIPVPWWCYSVGNLAFWPILSMNYSE